MLFLVRRTAYGLLLLLGVTFVSFLLMVYFGPDQTYELLGKSPTADQISEVRKQLGYDRPFLRPVDITTSHRVVVRVFELLLHHQIIL